MKTKLKKLKNIFYHMKILQILLIVHYVIRLIMVFQTVLPFGNLKLIHIATFSDALEVFQLLEIHGFSINDTTLDNYLTLHYACSKGSYKAASYILSKDPLNFT